MLAGVYGPVEPKAQKMIYDKASVEVVYSPLKGPASKIMQYVVFIRFNV